MLHRCDRVFVRWPPVIEIRRDRGETDLGQAVQHIAGEIVDTFAVVADQHRRMRSRRGGCRNAERHVAAIDRGCDRAGGDRLNHDRTFLWRWAYFVFPAARSRRYWSRIAWPLGTLAT